MTQIQTISPGGVVTGEGFYRLTMEQYHDAGICEGRNLSSTHIRRAFGGSAHEFWRAWHENPNRYPEKSDQSALNFGRAAHALVLGDEVFEDKFVLLPDDAPQRPTKPQIAAKARDGEWSEAAKPRGEFWENFDAEHDGKTIVTQEDYQTIAYMAENIYNSTEARLALTGGVAELSIIWKDPETGLFLKARPDNLPAEQGELADLKTLTTKGGDLFFAAQRSKNDHRYALQMALAGMGIEHLAGESVSSALLVFSSKTPPYECLCLAIDQEEMEFAKKAITATVRMLKACFDAHDQDPTFIWPQRYIGFQHTQPRSSDLDRLADIEMQLDREAFKPAHHEFAGAST